MFATVELAIPIPVCMLLERPDHLIQDPIPTRMEFVIRCPLLSLAGLELLVPMPVLLHSLFALAQPQVLG